MRRPEVGILALAMLASACAFPTESPNWDVTWNIPLPDNGQSIGVKTVLPSGVDTVTPAAGAPLAFRASVNAITPISRQLSTQCPSCTGTAPKPAFTAPLATTTVNLASGTSLVSATLVTGSQISILLTNGYSFDPLNPAGATTAGTITLAVNNGTTTLGTLTLTGGAGGTTIPAGGTRTVVVNLAGTINTSSPITVTMTMDSPAGSPVTMNGSSLFTAAATPTINVSTATVSIAAQAIPASTDTVDFDVPEEVINRIANTTANAGILFLTVVNPFTISASPTITFRSPTGTPAAQQITPVTKNITIPAAANGTTPANATLQVALTGQELRRMAGHELEVVFGGNTAAGTLTVTPTQKITFSQRVQITINIKEQP